MPKLKNLKQEEFCRLYASEEEFFGNGVRSYSEAYKIPFNTKDSSENMKNRKVCEASASRLLSKVKICERIAELLDGAGFNNENADKQLLFLMNQHGDRKVKIQALREYNALKSRIVQKVENTHKIESIEQIEKSLKSIGSQDNVGANKPRKGHRSDAVQG